MAVTDGRKDHQDEWAQLCRSYAELELDIGDNDVAQVWAKESFKTCRGLRGSQRALGQSWWCS